MEKFSNKHYELMVPALILFNQELFWECHEELEHHWLEEPGPVRNVYWAVIQVAASLIHYRDQKIVGAEGLINKSREKFLRVKNLGVESELLYSKLSWKELSSLVEGIPQKPTLENFEELFRFKFKV